MKNCNSASSREPARPCRLAALLIFTAPTACSVEGHKPALRSDPPFCDNLACSRRQPRLRHMPPPPPWHQHPFRPFVSPLGLVEEDRHFVALCLRFARLPTVPVLRVICVSVGTLSAAMVSPVPIPTQRPAALQHSARHITDQRGHTPCGGPGADTIPDRNISHDRASDEHMTL